MLITAENLISPFYMYTGLSVIPRMIRFTTKDKENHGDNESSSAPRTAPAAQAPQVLQTPTATTTTADTAPTPIIASSQATDLSNTSQDVDELDIQEHVQHQPATITDNVPNAMFRCKTL
ncbi:hypothetical protein Tco_0524268 [Tanacetum coccineum]